MRHLNHLRVIEIIQLPTNTSVQSKQILLDHHKLYYFKIHVYGKSITVIHARAEGPFKVHVIDEMKTLFSFTDYQQ